MLSGRQVTLGIIAGMPVSGVSGGNPLVPGAVGGFGR